MLVVFAVNEHDIRRFDVAMDEALAFGRNQGASNLAYDPQREIQPDRTGALNARFHGCAINKFHRVEETGLGRSQVEHASYIRMRKLGGGTSFPNKTLFDRVTGNQLSVNDLQ